MTKSDIKIGNTYILKEGNSIRDYDIRYLLGQEVELIKIDTSDDTYLVKDNEGYAWYVEFENLKEKEVK